jgi:hypothetical protein
MKKDKQELRDYNPELVEEIAKLLWVNNSEYQWIIYENSPERKEYIELARKVLDVVRKDFVSNEEIEDKCPKCKMPRKSICNIECYCALVKNGYISKESYDAHIKKLYKLKEQGEKR